MTNRPRGFWWLEAAMVSSALIVLLVTLINGEVRALPILLMIVAAVTLELTHVSIHDDFKMTLSVIALFVAIAYGGMLLAVTVGTVTGVVSGFTARAPRFAKGIFNTGMSIVEAAAGALTFVLIAQPSASVFAWPEPASLLESPARFTSALLAAGLVASVVNAVLLAAVLRVVTGVPYLETMQSLASKIMALQAVYVGLAAIAYVLLVRVNAVALLLLVVPLGVARQALRSVEKRQVAFDRMVGAFVETIQAKDGYTRGHAERVSELSVRVAERMGLSYEDRELIRYGAILHDVGKVGVSLGILCKAGPLTDDEFDEMKRHPDIGADILEDIDFLQPALAIVRHHHERMDGRGYPAGLPSGEIPLLTRVVTAVDAFDAMTSTRSYRRALPVEVAIGELQNNAGTQFDAEVVGHLVAVIEQDGWTLTDEPVALPPPIPAARS